jgi:hypothetical protein
MGIAHCPPVEVDMDTFVETVEEPTDEELEIMNESLSGLQIQLGLI